MLPMSPSPRKHTNTKGYRSNALLRNECVHDITDTEPGTMPSTGRGDLLSAGELDGRYLKLLGNLRENAAEHDKLRNMFPDRKFPRFQTQRREWNNVPCSERQRNNFENEEHISNRWGSVTRRILEEGTQRGQPVMRKKTKGKKTRRDVGKAKGIKENSKKMQKALKQQRKVEEAFATRSDVWLSKKQQTVDQGSFVAFIMYVIFLAVGMIIVYGVLEIGYNYYATALSKIFTQTSFNASLGITKTFEEIRTVDDLWDYIEQVFLKVMYGRSKDHTRSAFIDENGVFWLFENILVGIPRIRQVRVKNGSCTLASRVAGLFHSCYGYYSDKWSDTEPFGVGVTPPWRYSEPGSGSAVYRGKISSYGSGGYNVNITSDASKTTALIRELKENKWVREGTRAIFIDFTTYTPNTNLFCVVKLVFELPPSGGVIPTAHFYTVRFLRYVSTFDYLVFGAEMVFCSYVIWFTVEELIDLLILKKTYFFSLWNMIEATMLITAYATILTGLARHTMVKTYMQDYVDQIAKGQHQSFDTLLGVQLVFNTGIALLSFLVWVKLLKFALLFKSMAVIFSVFGRIKFQLLSLSVLITATIFAFAMVATMLFGDEVEQFSTIFNSLFSLVGLFYGGLYFYPRCAMAHTRVAPVFFMIYICAVFIFLVNIYVGLVVHGFHKAVKVLEDQREREYINDIMYKLLYRTLVFFRLKKKAAQMKYKKESAENKKNYKELVRIVKKHGFRGNSLVLLFRTHQVFPEWPLPFQKMSEVYEDIDTWTQLYTEISEHDRLLSNVQKAARKVELLDKAVSEMMVNVEILVADLLYEEKSTK